MSSETSTSKNYYELLDLEPSCSSEEIKRRFRQQVALFHPDKVSHLAKPLQDLAAACTAELTAAYSVLSNETKRSAYNRLLQEAAIRSASPDKSGGPAPDSALRDQDLASKAGPDVRVAGRNDRMEVDGFLHKAAMSRLRGAVQHNVPDAQEVQFEGFDAAFVVRSQWSLFRRETPCGRVLARNLVRVDPVAVRDAWCLALKPGNVPAGDTYLFLMGMALDAASKLSSSILELQHRRSANRKTHILVALLNVNTWETLIPKDAPHLLRAIIRDLQNDCR